MATLPADRGPTSFAGPSSLARQALLFKKRRRKFGASASGRHGPTEEKMTVTADDDHCNDAKDRTSPSHASTRTRCLMKILSRYSSTGGGIFGNDFTKLSGNDDALTKMSGGGEILGNDGDALPKFSGNDDADEQPVRRSPPSELTSAAGGDRNTSTRDGRVVARSPVAARASRGTDAVPIEPRGTSRTRDGERSEGSDASSPVERRALGGYGTNPPMIDPSPVRHSSAKRNAALRRRLVSRRSNSEYHELSRKPDGGSVDLDMPSFDGSEGLSSSSSEGDRSGRTRRREARRTMQIRRGGCGSPTSPR